MGNYTKGKIIEGCVTGIEKYGIFVNLDQYYSGLIHISEISNNFVRNIEDYVSIGETIDVKVLDIDEKNNQLKLSIKDIKYRKRKRERTKIVETKNGFNTLKNMLPNWIDTQVNFLKGNKAINIDNN